MATIKAMKNIFLLVVIFLIITSTKIAKADVYHLPKNTAQIIQFALYETDGLNLKTNAADGGTDCTIIKDQGVETTCTNDFADEGNTYSLSLTASELNANHITVNIIDAATKVYLDKSLQIVTVGQNIGQIDGLDTDGNNATLYLKQLDITNSAGDAFVVSSTGSNGDGMQISGNGSGAGMNIDGGATSGAAVDIDATGIGIDVDSSGTHGVTFNGGTNGGGLYITGAGTGHGLFAQGGTTGIGGFYRGGGSSGQGISAYSQGGNSPGFELRGNGSGPGLQAQGGGNGGDGIYAYAVTAGNGSGIDARGLGSGEGMFLQGGATGPGFSARGGATEGQGALIRAQAGNDHGIEFNGFGTGIGLKSVGGATGPGASFVGGATSGASIELDKTLGNTIDDAGSNGVRIHTLADDVLTASAIQDTGADKLAAWVWRLNNTEIEAASYTGLSSLNLQSPYGATAKQTNKLSVSAGTLSVYKADNTTVLDTQSVTSNASAEPITGLD